MKKEVKTILGKQNYLLGINYDNKEVWLEEISWDCGWYWGLGYVETYNEEYSDIEMHTHFNSKFLEKSIYNSFKNYFKETTLNDDEIWKLLEYMKTLYTLRGYSDMLHTGSSYVTKNECSDTIKNTEEYNRINQIVIPEVWGKVVELLSDEND